MIGIVARSYFLSEPMRGDEAFTFLNYANDNLASLFNYSDPNNHVLNTLLIKVATFFFQASPASIRFPAFLAGVLAIVIGFYAARTLENDKNAGVLTATTLAVFPYLILFSTNARGYSLILLFTLLLALSGLAFVNSLSKTHIFLMALWVALGMLAIPVMILPVTGIFLWVVCLLFLKKYPLNVILSGFVLPFGILSGVFTAAFYVPVIAANGIWAVIANKFVQPETWERLAPQITPHIQQSFAELSRDIHPVVLLLMAALAVLGMVQAARQRNWAILLLLPCSLLGACLVLSVQRVIPYPRIWIYFIPLVLLVADAGLVFILRKFSQRMQQSANIAIILIGLFFAVNLMTQQTISAYPDGNSFPEAPIAVEYLKPIIKSEDSLRVSPNAQWSVYFYLWYDKVVQPRLEHNAANGRLFFINKKSRGPLSDEAAQRFNLLFEMGNMAIYQEKN
jgi:hypothetical protein